ncbi:MAG: TlpA family protein disulfide reductase [Gammaproteobacteria bacterium]|nr:TlpA family protein disulfide reductase [Gammaproteobacteria bacterium]
MNKPLFSLVLLLIWLSTLSTAAHSAESLDLAKYRGSVVVLDFWASWCVPCKRSFPWLNEMHARYADEGLVIIGVNVDKDADEARAFLEKYPAQFRIHYDPDGELAEEFGVRGMPSSFVIGRDGQLAAQHLGFKVKKQAEYEATLATTLQQETTE